MRKANRFNGLKRIYKKLLGSRPIEEEHEIILDHNYDGIKELDNRLPPWWLYGFYATILFAVIYMVRFHIFNDYTQAEEYETEVAIAKAEIEAWKKTAKDLVDANTVTLLTDASDLSAGKRFSTKAVWLAIRLMGAVELAPTLPMNIGSLVGVLKMCLLLFLKGDVMVKGWLHGKAN